MRISVSDTMHPRIGNADHRDPQPHGLQPIRKGEAAKTYWVDFANSFSGPTQLTTTAVEGRGDLAYATGTYRMAVTPKKPGAKPLPVEQGKYIEVLKKQGDGSWKIVHDIWNADAPPAKQ